jgi:transcription elongation factor GreA
MEFVTPADKSRLERQLAEFYALDKVLTQRIAEARAQGDLRENADYHAAREDKSLNNSRIKELEDRLRLVQVVDSSEMPSDMVFLGATIRVRDEATGKIELYKLVSSLSDDGDFEYREVTGTSPMGEAFMKVRVGMTVRVNLPRGERRLTIIEIVA